MAGRCISVTRVALGSIRVMRTGGIMGEVVGMAASVARKHDTTPRDVYEKHLDELKELMKQGVAPRPKSYSNSAKPTQTSYVIPEIPEWLDKAGENLARKATVSVSSTLIRRTVDPVSVKHINDGEMNIRRNAGRWVSERGADLESDPHWVLFKFVSPVTINAVRIASGQEGGIMPIEDFVLQKREGDEWKNIPNSRIIGNKFPVSHVRFDPVKSDAYRLLITKTPENMARLWEVELYMVSDCPDAALPD